MDDLRPVQFRIQDILVGLDADQLRHIAFVASEAAVQGTALEDPIVLAGLQKLYTGSVDLTLRQALQQLVSVLDEAYFDAQDLQEKGQASERRVMEAFFRARAANAVLAGLSDDAQIAASDAVYEAYHALGNDENFLTGIASQARQA